MGLDDLFKALGGMEGSGGGQEEDPLADLLGGILGGGEQGGADMGSLLESLMGGGGGGAEPGMDDMLGAILGGGEQSGGGGLAGILGGLLGGGQSGGSGGFLGPIVSELAEKLGLPPAVAQMVVSFVMGKLLTGQRGGQPVLPTQQSRASDQPQGLDLDSLLERMGSDDGVDDDFIRSTGMPEELAEKTGLDPDAAAKSLQEVLGMLSGQFGSQGSAPPKKGGLEDLLDSW